MKTAKPTPIPKRASAPKPLLFPHPDPNIQVSKMGNVYDIPFSRAEVRAFIAHCIARTIYKTLEMPHYEIIDMGQEQFEAFCRSMLEDE